MAKASGEKLRKVPAVQELQDLLRGAGLRSTAPRVAVLEHFHAHGGQISHAELFEVLGGRGFDRATVYRILVDLTEVGILARIDLGDHVWRFELRTGEGHTEEHPHFVCTDCGEVSCLPGLTLKLASSAKAPKAVAKNEVAIQLKGRCDNCS